MKSIIEKLYGGELEPGADYTAKCQEYRDAKAALVREQEFFEEKLRDVDPKLECCFRKLMDDVNFPVFYEQLAMFTGAFKLGARFMLEVLQDDEE